MQTLPIPIYTISPDGEIVFSINFGRIIHGGCNYLGIAETYKNQWAPKKIGIWKMDFKTEKIEMIMSIRGMANILYPNSLSSETLNGTLYYLSEKFNPSGDRFIVFIKDVSEAETRRTFART